MIETHCSSWDPKSFTDVHFCWDWPGTQESQWNNWSVGCSAQPLSNANEYTIFKGVWKIRVFHWEQFSQRKRRWESNKWTHPAVQNSRSRRGQRWQSSNGAVPHLHLCRFALLLGEPTNWQENQMCANQSPLRPSKDLNLETASQMHGRTFWFLFLLPSEIA